MDALLESTRGNLVCSSVQDVQDRLHRLLASRSSDTRAEHASFTFELRHNVVFHLNRDAENGTADGVDNPTEQSHHQPITQSVNAFETVQNQPSDDPILQRAVAKHIIGAMGIVDNSSWTVRKVSRDSHGWTFTYICKDSLQAWTRANAKNTEKHVIGSYSGPGSLDPINASRPAFDCRGTLTIAFSKSARGVIIKYDHTLIHKTVAQLVDLIAPTLPPPPVNNGGTGNQRTPRAKRPPPAEGEEGSRKKRSRKKEKAPEAPMEGPPSGDGQINQNNAVPQDVNHGGAHVTVIPWVPYVPPDEVKRRRQMAIDLLNGRHINPATLSEEQFNIFANQAPDLQEKSLALLAEHGADKLRIVHPDDKDADPTPIERQFTNTTPATGSGQVSTPGTTETPTKKRRSRKKKPDGAVGEVSIGDGAVVSVQQSGEIGTTTSTLKLTTKITTKKTRGSCETCRDRKLKCTKEHPICSVCTAAEVECVYLPPKPRRKRAGISAEVVENEDSDLPGEREEFQAQMQSQEASLPMPTTTQMPMEYQAPAIAPPIPDPDNEEFIPDPNILSGPVEHPPATTQPSIQSSTQYYQNHADGLTFPQNPKPTATSTVTFPESQARETQSESPNLVFSSTSHQTQYPSGSTFPPPAPATSQKAQSTPISNRRSLPTTQNKQAPIPTPVPPPSIPQHAPNWNSSSTPGHTTTASPTLAQQQTSRRSRSRKSDVEIRQQANDSVRQPPAISQVAAQNQRQPSPATGSPYQTATRAKSRQDHRSQTNTPVVSASRPPPQAPQAAVSTSYNTTASASIPSYDPYPRYDNTTNSQYNNSNNDQGSTRIAYEPGSYQAHTAAVTSASYSSAPAYDYPRTTSSSNPLSQALNSSSGYSNTSSSTATPQWSTSQTRGSQLHAQPQTNNTYPMASATASASNNYGTSSAESRTSHQNTPYTQSQSQSYNSYSAQQPSTNQQPQQSWYGFSANNNNSSAGANQNAYSSNRSSGYGGTASSNQTAYSNHRSNVSNYPGHSYGSGSDDQSIYELLRANNSTH